MLYIVVFYSYVKDYRKYDHRFNNKGVNVYFWQFDVKNYCFNNFMKNKGKIEEEEEENIWNKPTIK